MALLKSDKPHELYVEIGQRIRTLRTRQGGQRLGQEELGKAASLTRASIANIELGRQRMRVDTLYDIASALGVPVSSLLPDPGKHTPEADVDELFERLRPEAQKWIEETISLV